MVSSCSHWHHHQNAYYLELPTAQVGATPSQSSPHLPWVQRRWQNAPAPIQSPHQCRAEAMVLWHLIQSGLADTHTQAAVAMVSVEVQMDVTLAAGVATKVTVAPPWQQQSRNCG